MEIKCLSIADKEEKLKNTTRIKYDDLNEKTII